MSREYRMFEFARLVVALALVWAVGGSLVFSRILHYSGWDRLGPEMQVMLFAGLSLIGAIVLAFAILAILQLFGRRRFRAR
jgi:hypothetical protein